MKNDDTAVAAVRRTRAGWQVHGEIPAAYVWGRKVPKATLEGQVWDLSFGRYDYPAGDGTPVLSSTSPFTPVLPPARVFKFVVVGSQF